ncbi:response regulator transcription factor [Pusillimonas noertemannii]|uniref:Regulatory LuxR family protein n=1 Tax=Pusillimonas noertemannii TaxID=305977 RepID=A0A2U1CN34_9BURK|nr:LuxR C-terminal-related transcriptional regulator [Pusillimonas noertemannii]NYT68558.1 helix-turn-helix transcriptional regulator [Pusillimonas noertemannii]PVY62425.1 regulatory LuxR family protein [Pusillimonas noertemannii]TFL10612.1 helix-turn-helix transcriptional regulator [Pusillimonas noertemannii]
MPNNRPIDALISTLTPRERDVMHFVAMGAPNKIIAAELGVSQRTIEAHRARCFQKLQVRNAVELARRVMSLPQFRG